MESLESDTDEKELVCLAYSQKYITFYKSTLEKRKFFYFFNEFIIF